MIAGCDQSVLAVQELQEKENVKVIVGSALLWMYKKGLPTSTEVSNESTHESRRLREPLKILLGGWGLLQASRRRNTVFLSSIYESLFFTQIPCSEALRIGHYIIGQEFKLSCTMCSSRREVARFAILEPFLHARAPPLDHCVMNYRLDENEDSKASAMNVNHFKHFLLPPIFSIASLISRPSQWLAVAIPNTIRCTSFVCLATDARKFDIIIQAPSVAVS